MGSERRSSARLSMNTMLKDARIFDEDSSESEISRIKKEVKTEPSLEDARNKLSMVIKMELNEDATVQIKKEKDVKIKQEVFDEETNTFDNVFGNINLKKEITDQLKSPMKVEYDENSSNSCETNSRKTFKRAALSKESPYKRKVRESPYKVPNSPLTSNSNAPQSGPSTSRRETLRKRKISEMEQDPEVLSRRQKQIDYGKNTIGYDTYIQAVPRSQRAENDPQTPNKHNKYSRRGWDGLIKQWRLKLHKYDPAETENP